MMILRVICLNDSLRNTKSDCDFKGKIILTADWLAK